MFVDVLRPACQVLPPINPEESCRSDVSGPNPEKLTIDRIYSSPSLSGPSPRSLRFAPDGKQITFLKGKDSDYRQLDLWTYDISSAQSRILVDSDLLGASGQLSDEEKARRERKRLFSHGIVEYMWGKGGDFLIFPINGQIFHCDLSGESPQVSCLTDHESDATDVKCSPCGSFVSFVREQNLYALDLASNSEVQLTSDGGGCIKNGMAEFIAQEEMGRYTGYWWSGDGKHMAFTRIDESPVEVTQRYEIHADSFAVFDQRYPYAGTANVTVQLGVVEIASGKTRWVDLGPEQDIYLCRVNWMPGSRQLSFQRQTRDQSRLDLIIFDLETGELQQILQETSETWVNLNNDLRFLRKQPAFIWASEKTGYKHLYLHDSAGKLIHPLSSGEWAVGKVLGVDEKEGRVYFEASKEDLLQKHAYWVDFENPEKVHPLTDADGWHDVRLSPGKTHYIDSFSSPDVAPQVSLCKVKGGREAFLEENALDGTHPYYPFLKAHSKPEFGFINASDGKLLAYKLIKPVPFDPSMQYPVIVQVYGGPHARRVKKEWDQGDSWAQMMANQGYVMFALDNRGSCDRGRVFEEPIHRQLGAVEVEDQKAGADFLKEQPYVNSDKIGMFGWSYGGYLTVMCLLKESDAFSAGVAVAPVTDWKLYDTHYTERYLGHPEENAEGYQNSSVFPYVDGLKGKLMVVHGMADDNVLFTNTTKLYKALQEKGMAFETMPYPGAKHSIAERSNRIHLFRAITSFFDRWTAT